MSEHMIVKSAHEIAGDPDFYNASIVLNNSKMRWKCMGYSRSGFSVKFGRLVQTVRGLRQINRYVDPDEQVMAIKEG